jgi:hypothetical protein
MQVEMWSLDRIKPYEKNPRINDDAVAPVVQSINEFGFRQPIVVDPDGVIIVGHTRWKAAKQLNLAEVPVHVATDLEPEAVKAYQALVLGHNVSKESIAVYVPDRWMVGQLPTKSNICGRKWKQTRFFNDARNADHSDSPFFAVLGPHRSGTSCVAMVMHHLGVHMGNELGGYEATGGGEAIGLANLCENAMRFPAIEPFRHPDPTQRIEPR